MSSFTSTSRQNLEKKCIELGLPGYNEFRLSLLTIQQLQDFYIQATQDTTVKRVHEPAISPNQFVLTISNEFDNRIDELVVNPLICGLLQSQSEIIVLLNEIQILQREELNPILLSTCFDDQDRKYLGHSVAPAMQYKNFNPLISMMDKLTQLYRLLESVYHTRIKAFKTAIDSGFMNDEGIKFQNSRNSILQELFLRIHNKMEYINTCICKGRVKHNLFEQALHFYTKK